MTQGFPVRSSLDNATTGQYGKLVVGLAERAKSIVRDLDPTNLLTFFRLKSHTHEVIRRVGGAGARTGKQEQG